MRIIHVIDSLNEAAGGPAQACIEMAAAAARQGHEVAIYALGDSRPAWCPALDRLPARFSRDGVHVHLFSSWGGLPFRLSPTLLAALDQAVPTADAVHAHVLYGFHLWAAGQVCRRYGVPLIVRPCGILNGYVAPTRKRAMRLAGLAFQDRLLREASLIHYTTTQEASDAAPYVNNPRYAVVPLEIQPAAYQNLPGRTDGEARYPEIKGRKVVLYFGRLDPKKRLDLAVLAVAAMVREGHDLHFLIAGADAGSEAACRALVAEQGLAERTTFTGLLTGEAKRVVLGAADLFILPSMSENFGIAVVEAAASGIPLLISDAVNVAPTFAQDEAAVIVAAGSLEGTISGLRTLLDNPERARETAVRGQRVVWKHFTWDAVVDRLLHTYREAGATRVRDQVESPCASLTRPQPT